MRYSKGITNIFSEKSTVVLYEHLNQARCLIHTTPWVASDPTIIQIKQRKPHQSYDPHEQVLW